MFGAQPQQQKLVKRARRVRQVFLSFFFSFFFSTRIRSDSQGERKFSLKAEGTLSKGDIHPNRGSAAPPSPSGAGSLGSTQSHALGGEAVSHGLCQVWDDLIKVAIHARIPEQTSTRSEPLGQNYLESGGRHQTEMRKPGWRASKTARPGVNRTTPHLQARKTGGHLEWHSNLKAGQLSFKHFSWIKILLELSHFY